MTKEETIIKDILQGKKTVSYEEFKKAITIFFQNIIDTIDNKIVFKISNDLPSGITGYCNDLYKKEDEQVVIINEQVTKKIYEGNKLEIYKIYHEIKHLIDNNNIKNNIVDKENMRIIKEKAIIHYLNNKEENLGYKYYYDNYFKESGEILADWYGIKQMEELFEKLHIKLNFLNRRKIENKKRELQNNYLDTSRYIRSLGKYKKCELNLDTIFDLIYLNNQDLSKENHFFKRKY